MLDRVAEPLNTSALRFDPITAVIGAEVSGIDLSAPQNPQVIDELRNALWKHKVLVFRDQDLDDEDQIRFTEYFGPITPAHPIENGLAERPAVKLIDVDNFKTKYTSRKTALDDPLGWARFGRPSPWHIDITFVANPTIVTVLRSLDVPAQGGDTLYVNLEALYESFSPAFQAFFDTLQEVHARDDGARGRAPPPRFDGRPPGPFAAVHPLVRIHPATGRKVLFHAPNFAKAIVGVRPEESSLLLDFFDREIAARADLQLRLRWADRMLVVWDNCATAHNGPVDAQFIEGRRVIHRTTAAGPLTKGPGGVESRPLVGELFNTME
jgi:taurine dioxygenase